jgi:hypothetical protein
MKPTTWVPGHGWSSSQGWTQSCLPEISQAIKNKQLEHWINWLKNINAKQIYIANKYVTNEPSNFFYARVPDLIIFKDGNPFTTTTNSTKAEVAAKSFFLLPPPIPTTPDFVYL